MSWTSGSRSNTVTDMEADQNSKYYISSFMKIKFKI